MDLSMIFLLVYLVGGFFWAGVSVGIAWYESCQRKTTAGEYTLLFLVSYIVWPITAFCLFRYLSPNNLESIRNEMNPGDPT